MGTPRSRIELKIKSQNVNTHIGIDDQDAQVRVG